MDIRVGYFKNNADESKKVNEKSSYSFDAQLASRVGHLGAD